MRQMTDKEWLYAHPGRTLAERPLNPSIPVPRTAEQKIADVTEYVQDLCFKAPEVFPSGQEVQTWVGYFLGLWDQPGCRCSSNGVCELHEVDRG
jgi:hypothetical protein